MVKQQEKKVLVKSDKLTQGEKKKIKNDNKAKANPDKAAAKKEKNDAKRAGRYVCVCVFVDRNDHSFPSRNVVTVVVVVVTFCVYVPNLNPFPSFVWTFFIVIARRLVPPRHLTKSTKTGGKNTRCHTRLELCVHNDAVRGTIFMQIYLLALINNTVCVIVPHGH